MRSPRHRKPYKKRDLLMDGIIKHNVRHLEEAYSNAVGMDARWRIRQAINRVKAGA